MEEQVEKILAEVGANQERFTRDLEALGTNVEAIVEIAEKIRRRLPSQARRKVEQTAHELLPERKARPGSSPTVIPKGIRA